MASDIKIDPMLELVPLTLKASSKKSDEAVAASFLKLDELLELVVREEIDVKSAPKSGGGLDHASILNLVRESLLESPDDFMKAMKILTPYVQSGGKQISDRLERVKDTLLELQEAIKGKSKESLEADFKEHLQPLFLYEAASKEALEGLCTHLMPLFEKLRARAPHKFQNFANGVVPVLSLVALRNPGEAKRVLSGFESKLESVFDLDEGSQTNFFNQLQEGLRSLTTTSSDPSVRKLVNEYVRSGTSDSPKPTGSLAEAMYFLQQFQIALSKSQASENQTQVEISSAMISQAVASQQQVDKQVDAQIKAAEKAAHRPWWEKLVMVVVAVVAVVAAFFTAGTGAALVACAVGAFMASPGFSSLVSVISDAISKLLVPIYEAEGMSQADAEAKANAVGNIIAKVVVTIVVMLVSCGLGGITTAADTIAEDTAEVAAESGAEVAAESAGGVTTDVASSAGKVGWNGVRGAKMALFEGVSTLTGSGIALDTMMTNPEWAKKHQSLVIALGILATIVGVIASMICGKVAFSGMNVSQAITEKLPNLVSMVTTVQYVSQMIQGVEEGVFSIQTGMLLKKQADITRSLGLTEANLGRLLSLIQLVSDSLDTNNSSANNVTKQIGDAMSLLGRNSGGIWKSTSNVMTR